MAQTKAPVPNPGPFYAGPGPIPKGVSLPWGKILAVLIPLVIFVGWLVFLSDFFPKKAKPRQDVQATMTQSTGKSLVDSVSKSGIGVPLGEVPANGHVPTTVSVPVQPMDTSDRDRLIEQLTKDNAALNAKLKQQKPATTPIVDPDVQAAKQEAKRLAEERRKEEEESRRTLVVWSPGKSSDGKAARVGLQPPVANYMLSAAWKINCSVENAINSDIPGPIVARTLSPVYDSIRGDDVLIPAGSTWYGQQRGNVIFGERRVPVTLAKLSFPNGSSLAFGQGLQGLDGGGQAGLTGDVDNHWGSVILGYILLGGKQGLSQGMAGGMGMGVEERIGVSVGQEAMSDMSQRTKRLFNPNPTITAAPGERCLLILDDDVPFPGPYVAGVR